MEEGAVEGHQKGVAVTCPLGEPDSATVAFVATHLRRESKIHTKSMKYKVKEICKIELKQIFVYTE